MEQQAWPQTSVALIMAARENEQEFIALADGDAHVLPDIICRHAGCNMAFSKNVGHWANNADNVRRREQWRYGNCPEHDA